MPYPTSLSRLGTPAADDEGAETALPSFHESRKAISAGQKSKGYRSSATSGFNAPALAEPEVSRASIKKRSCDAVAQKKREDGRAAKARDGGSPVGKPEERASGQVMRAGGRGASRSPTNRHSPQR